MKKVTKFFIDNLEVEASGNETIWQVAKRYGTTLPHLCYADKPGYRADGNCRACMVNIEGERVLAASCIRKPAEGMKVTTLDERSTKSREMVIELLVTDQPEKRNSHDPNSHFWNMAKKTKVDGSRFDKKIASDTPIADNSNNAMSVNLDACIHCNLCVRACREVQVNDVIGMGQRGHTSKIIFDFDDPMGDSTCVSCGECVQACPTGALMEANLLDENGKHKGKPDREVDSLCPYCGVGCQLTYQIKDDKIVSAVGRDGPANNNRLCVKGRFGFDYIHNPERITKPLIRKKGAKKIANEKINPLDPSSHFREASWEEALNLAASRLKNIRDNSPGKALAGLGCAKGSNEEAYLFQKLVRTGFNNNNVDHCTRMCHASSVAALMEAIGTGAVTAPVSEIKNAEVAIIIGARPSQNHPVAATYIKNAVKKGLKLVIADPREQELSKLAEKNLHFKPGTDVSLLNGMINVIIEEGLADRQYIEKFTEGYLELKEHVKDFTPEEMEKICNIPAEEIRETARLFANAKSAMIFWGMGISQHIHGTDNSRCLISLALITGNVGRPGTGLHPLRGQNNVQGASDVGLIPMVFPDYLPISDANNVKFFEQYWETKLDPNPGLTVVEIMESIYERKIKGLYVMGENPAMSDPNANHAREALSRLDTLIVQDIFLTETAYLADIVLPASAFPEKTGTFTNTDRRVQLARKAVNPPGEAKQDWWIIQELAKRFDLGWSYSGPDEIYDELRNCMESIKNISWERLVKEGAVTYPCDAEDKPGNEVIFGEGFPTNNKKGRLVPAKLIDPDEKPDKDFPFVLTTGRLLEHWHTGSMTMRAKILNSIEPEPYVHISKNDMKNNNLTQNDTIELQTRRGKITVKVRKDRMIPDGLVFMPFCFEKAPVNLLTNQALDPDGKIPELKYCAAKISKINV
ncbi:MAG: formate dehydrogenase subunit alpha [Rickettsiales bacterium]|nr:formate dehydrogenase subunit alpha [Rickettsiales bacterium]